MRVGGSTFASVCLAVGTSLIAGCGGGGMGGSYSMGASAPPAASASVTFTSPTPGSIINFGRSVKLSWTSTNVSSCTASMSSAMGGTFSGTQPATGSMTVVPTAPGSVTYTLSCTATSGGMAATGSMAVMVSASILSTLTMMTSIGSTVDPTEHGGNPYGLALATSTAGLITAGDLIVCNFNDGATNTQGAGTTIVGLHPAAGATPYRIAQSPILQGCNALAMLPDGSISASAYTANQSALVAPTGALSTPFAADTFHNPWGVAYVAANGANPAALYVANADGSIVRINLDGDAQTDVTQIASGFCGSGQPGAIFAPAGLTYDASIDTLYIVDTSSDSVVAFANVSSIGAAGVVVAGNCASVSAPPTPAPTFSGPAASSARVIAHGAPFIAPISAALLANGDLIVGNGDVNIAADQTPNLVVEVSPVLPGGFVGQPVQLDASGTPGALFGIVATTDPQLGQLVYFNDDNTNTVMLLSGMAGSGSTGGMPMPY